MARPYLFDQQELDLFELDADNFNSESVRKHYRRFMLQHHPDKGGTNEMCARGNSVYQDLLEGLLTFSVWLNSTPGLTLADTIRPRPGQSRGSSNAAQLAPRASDLAPAPDLAPTFHAEGHCHLFSSLEQALSQMGFLFGFSWVDMAKILRATPVGNAVTFAIRGAVQPARIRYHGTSFAALASISANHFLPVWGAGRGKALQQFGEDLPVVYTSPCEDQASWYPQAMVDAKGNRVGELVCLGATPMRVVLICSAAVEKRRIKIRRKNNKQDAWLPADIEVCGVRFRMMKDAINHPKATPSPEARGGVWCQYPVDLEPSDEEPEHQSETSAAQSGGFQADEPEQQSESSSDESARWFNGAELRSESLPKRRRPCSTSAGSVLSISAAGDIKVGQQIRALVARQCMLLKIHRDDPRSNANIAFDYLQLVRLRHKYVQRKQLNWEAPLSEEDIKNIWKEDIHQLFHDERPKNWTKTRPQLHSIFRVWLRESFGNVTAIRDILRHTCSWATWEEIELTQNLMTAV
jgi:hypothetical protein